MLAGAAGRFERTNIEVLVESVRFADHELFGEEDRLCAALRAIYREYRRRVGADRVSHLNRRVRALAAATKAVVDKGAIDAASNEAVLPMCADLFKACSERISEQVAIRTTSKRLYTKWTELKDLRNSQGFVSTRVRLQARLVGTAGDGASAGRAKGKGRGRGQGGGDGGSGEVASYTSSEEARRELLLAKRLVERFGTLLSASKLASDNMAAQCEELLQRYDELLDQDVGQEECIFVLTDGEAETKDAACTAPERRRREAARRLQYFVKLTLNGQLVARTKACALAWPHFEVAFKQALTVQVARRPTSIQVEVWQTGSLVSSRVAGIMVPVPGAELMHVSTNAIAPQRGMYEFCSETALRVHKYAGGGGAAAAAGAGRGKTLAQLSRERLGEDGQDSSRTVVPVIEASGERFSCGLAHVTVSWGTEMEPSQGGPGLPGATNAGPSGRVGGGDDDDDAGQVTHLLPKTSATLAQGGKLIGDRKQDRGGAGGGVGGVDGDATTAEELYDQDFIESMWRVGEIDPNDPRNAAMVKLNEALQLAEQRVEAFRLDALPRELLLGTADPTVYRAPRRLRLLQLRQNHPHLFPGGIPLSEDTIKKDARLQGLLAPVIEEEGGDDLESHAEAAQRRIKDFVQRVRLAQVGVRRKKRNAGIHVSSCVKEGPLPVFRLDLSSIKRLFEPRRRLRPVGQDRKPVFRVDKLGIFIHIMRGKNIPVRRNNLGRGASGRLEAAGRRGRQESGVGGGGSDEQDDEIEDAGHEQDRVMSFVEIDFQASRVSCVIREHYLYERVVNDESSYT